MFTSRRRAFAFLVAALAGLLWPAAGYTVTITLDATQDNMLEADDDRRSDGVGQHFCVGVTGQGTPSGIRRAVLRFDIATAGIPAGSTITSATLQLNLNRAAPNAGPAANYSLHRVTASWGEGNSDASDGECKGASSQLNDASWRYRLYDPGNEPGSPQWASLGGDFAGTASASSSIAGTIGNKTWSAAGMVADVQLWFSNPGLNHGWLLKRVAESGSSNAVRFASRNSSAGSNRPKLTIIYNPPPVTGACCFPGQACQVLTAADCGSQGGNFLGAGTTCSGNPCPPDPTGACCFNNGTCSEISATICSNQSGDYQGDGAACGSIECPIVLVPFIDALPVPAAAVPVSGTAGGTATYHMAMREVQQRFHRDLPLTTVWGFGDRPSGAGYPGPTIVATTGQPVTVSWINDLRDTSLPGNPPPFRTDHYLDVPGTGPPPGCSIHGAADQPKVVAHLHGGHVPAAYDGYPEDAFLPGSQLTYVYPNRQPPGNIWYHDHALGITRLNVYMGLAGFYLITDAYEQSLGLPACPDSSNPSTCFEIGLAVQDRSFYPDGRLMYPSTFVDRFLGDKIVVNGKVWPYLDVRQGKYRFRVLNGSTTRTYTLSLDRLDLPGSQDLSFTMIGTDAGLRETPLVLDEITVSPGERADIVVDFAGLPVNTEIVLTNSAPAPFPGPPGAGVIPNVMKFIVGNQPGHTTPLPSLLRPVDILDELDAVRSRDFVLDMEEDACGGMWMINGLHFDDIVEYPQLGTSEVWRFINPRNVMHPMHMHLVLFQVLDRTPVGGGSPIPPRPEERGWKDTVQADANMVTRVITRFTDFEGRYPYHCHILEHEEHQMMRQFWSVGAVALSISRTGVSWAAQPGATSYDVVRGDLGALSASGGNFALSTVTQLCLGNDIATTSVPDLATPASGAGFWYLSRSNGASGPSTYDDGSSTQVDTRDNEILTSGNNCP